MTSSSSPSSLWIVTPFRDAASILLKGLPVRTARGGIAAATSFYDQPLRAEAAAKRADSRWQTQALMLLKVSPRIMEVVEDPQRPGRWCFATSFFINEMAEEEIITLPNSYLSVEQWRINKTALVALIDAL